MTRSGKTAQMLPYQRAESSGTNRGNLPDEKRTAYEVSATTSVIRLLSARPVATDTHASHCWLFPRQVQSHERDAGGLHRSHLLCLVRNIVNSRSIPERRAGHKRPTPESELHFSVSTRQAARPGEPIASESSPPRSASRWFALYTHNPAPAADSPATRRRCRPA
jgi:hypothetical protein